MPVIRKALQTDDVFRSTTDFDVVVADGMLVFCSDAFGSSISMTVAFIFLRFYNNSDPVDEK